MRVRLYLAGLSVLLLASRSAPGSATENDPPIETPPRDAAAATGKAVGDEFLRGYIVSFLEQVFHEGRERVQVAVARGVVTLSGSVGTPEEIDHARRRRRSGCR